MQNWPHGQQEDGQNVSFYFRFVFFCSFFFFRWKSKANQKQVQGDLRAAIRHYQDALLLVRGGFMEDCKLAWSDEPRRAFERDLLQCLERLGLCCQEVGLFPELEEVALRILLEDSCHQVAHRLLMEAYLGQERPEQAVRHFEKKF